MPMGPAFVHICAISPHLATNDLDLEGPLPGVEPTQPKPQTSERTCARAVGCGADPWQCARIIPIHFLSESADVWLFSGEPDGARALQCISLWRRSGAAKTSTVRIFRLGLTLLSFRSGLCRLFGASLLAPRHSQSSCVFADRAYLVHAQADPLCKRLWSILNALAVTTTHASLADLREREQSLLLSAERSGN